MLKRFTILGLTLCSVLLVLFLYQQSTETPETVPSHDAPPPETAVKSNLTEIPGSTAEDPIEVVTVSSGVGIGDVTGFIFTKRDDKGRIENEFGFDKRRVNSDGDHQLENPCIKLYSKDRLVKITAEQLTTPFDNPGQLPDTGSLRGKVHIELFPQDGLTLQSIEPEPQQREMLVELERVNFQREFSRIQAPGRVKITSEMFQAAGRQLTIQYDQLHKRLAELELREIDFMTFVGKSLAPPTSSATAGAGDTASTIETNLPAKPARLYRLSLVDNVVIRQSDNRIEADRIEIMARDQRLTSNQITDDTSPAAAPGEDENLVAADDSTPVTLTAKGALRIIPAESNELPDTQNLAVRAFGGPVKLWKQEQLAMQAGELRYDPDSKLCVLASTKTQPVRLTLGPQQWASAESQAQLNLKTGLAVLSGPGRIVTQVSDSSESLTIDYQDSLKLKFAADEQVEWIEFSGQLQAQTAENRIQADQGRLVFTGRSTAESAIDAPAAQQLFLDTLQLDGNVQAASEDLNFSSDHLTAEFQKDAGHSGRPARILAQGFARAESSEYLIEAAEMIEITFKPLSDQQLAGRNDPDSESSGLFGNQNDLQTAIAGGPAQSVRVTHKEQQIRIIGDRLEGDFEQQHWKVSGQPARIENLAAGRDFQTLESSSIIANIQTGQYEIPGRGSLTALVRSDVQGGSFEQDAPALIRWKQSATYDLLSRKIELQDVVIHIDQPTPATQIHTQITTPALSILLSEDSKSDPDVRRQEIGRLSSLVAHGPRVHLVRKEIDQKTLQPVSLVEMRSNRLTFDNATGELTVYGNGWLEMTDFIGKQADNQDEEGANIRSDQPSYTLIRFRDHMRYNTIQRTIHLAGNVMLDRLPLVIDIPLDHTGGPGIHESQQLTCETLSLGLANQTQKDESAQQSLVDFKNLNHLAAEGNVFYETVLNGRHHTFTAHSLLFDKKTNLATFQGTIDLPVQFDHIRFFQVRINVQTGDIDTKPIGHSEFANRF